MSLETHTAESVVAMIDSMVTSSGGTLRLDDFDHASGRLSATYEVREDRDCEMCYFEPAHVEAFLREALATHGVAFSEVVITTVKA